MRVYENWPNKTSTLLYFSKNKKTFVFSSHLWWCWVCCHRWPRSRTVPRTGCCHSRWVQLTGSLWNSSGPLRSDPDPQGLVSEELLRRRFKKKRQDHNVNMCTRQKTQVETWGRHIWEHRPRQRCSGLFPMMHHSCSYINAQPVACDINTFCWMTNCPTSYCQ